MIHQSKLMTKSIHGKLFFFAILSVCILLYLFIMATSVSPIVLNDTGSDSAFFRLVGQGITRKMLPYRDFYDQKGPYLFFIEYLGQIISYGRSGIFFLLWLNYILCLFVVIKIYELFGINNYILQIVLVLIL